MSGGRRTRAPARVPRAAELPATQAAITVLGDRANVLIIRQAFRRARRYQAFKQQLGMSDAVLSSRLRDLVDIGVLHLVQYSTHPPRSEYRLTEIGKDLWRTAVAIWTWEHTWGDRTIGRLPSLIHERCGNVTTAEFGCAGCATAPVATRDLNVDVARAIEQIGRSPVRRYRRASWKPAPSVDLYADIDALIGDRWTVATLSAAMVGVSRFGDFQRTLDISPPLLSQRLTDLVERGVLERITPPDGGAHQHYRLTRKGRDLIPIMLCNFSWAIRWYALSDGPPATITHVTCGGEFVPTWFCADCGKPLDRDSMHFAETDTDSAW
jgi:DNA-binding HxlR family transcriptional regulator